MNQGTKWGLLMKKNRSKKSRASVPLNRPKFQDNGNGLIEPKKVKNNYFYITANYSSCPTETDTGQKLHQSIGLSLKVLFSES